MNYKQRLSSYDIPGVSPAALDSMDSLDLSHAINSYRPAYQYDLDDIPGLPIFKKNGKFKRFVTKPKVVIDKKRISSMPLFKTSKELPSVPRCVSNQQEPQEQPQDGLQDGLQYQEDSTHESLEKAMDQNLHPDELPLAQTYTPSSPVSYQSDLSRLSLHSYQSPHSTVNNSPRATRVATFPFLPQASPTTKYIVDDDDDDIDSLFSCNKSKYSRSSCMTQSSHEDAKSILEVVQFYENEQEESSSVYSGSAISNISEHYIDEPVTHNSYFDDMISVKDSLFSSDGGDSNIGNSVVSLGQGFSNTTTASPMNSDSLLSFYKNMPASNSSLNKDKDLPLPPSPLPTPPLVLKKTRDKKSKDTTEVKTTASVPNTETAAPSQLLQPNLQPSSKFTRGHRHTTSMPQDFYQCPQNKASVSNISSMSCMSTNSLWEAKNEIKHIVRQRPFSYCLDSPKDYSASRYAPPVEKLKSNPYRSTSQPYTPTNKNKAPPQQLHTPISSPTQSAFSHTSKHEVRFSDPPAQQECLRIVSTPKKLPPTPQDTCSHLSTPQRSVTQPISLGSPSSETSKEVKMKNSIASFLVKEKETQQILLERNNTRGNRYSRTYF